MVSSHRFQIDSTCTPTQRPLPGQDIPRDMLGTWGCMRVVYPTTKGGPLDDRANQRGMDAVATVLSGLQDALGIVVVKETAALRDLHARSDKLRAVGRRRLTSA